MHESERHERLLALLLEQPFASVRDLQRVLGVSAATVRRDIDHLDGRSLARKVYGGVSALDGYGARRSAAALPFIENRDIAVTAKMAIATEAEALVRDGSAIIVHGGSTCFHFGCRMAQRNVRVFTNSMPLAAYLSEHGTCQLTVGGGDLHREPGIVYEATDPARPLFYASQFFVGALGLSDEGVLERHPLLVRFIADMCALANEIVVLVDSRKFSERPPTVSLPMSRIDTLITDDAVSDKDAQMVEQAGVRLLVARTDEVAH